MVDQKINLQMSPFHYDRNVCNHLSNAEALEWLVTNGIGGFATGTVANMLTRRHHGLLIAALKDPSERTLLVTKLDETVEYEGQVHRIFTNRWGNILVEPHGYRHIEHFHLEGMIPVWTYSFGNAYLEKRIWMKPGENTTYVFYRARQNTTPLILSARALVNYRNFNDESHSNNEWPIQVKKVEHGLRIHAFEGAVPFRILSDRAKINQEYHWYRNFSLKLEQNSNFAENDNHLNVGEFYVTLAPDECVTFAISTETSPELNGALALAERQGYERKLLSLAPNMPAQLVLAADQFIVKRPGLNQTDECSIIAGYPWLRDWTRDTLISLPGLTLATGRCHEARSLLKSFAPFVSQGMLPSFLPGPGETSQYNTADVTLWYFEAIRAYFEETNDLDLLSELFPILVDIIDWHERGTRYNIHIDPTDGLLYAGEPGTSLTWMDSRVGDWIVTPRTGKPVEINALWYNALCCMVEFAECLHQPSTRFKELAKRVRVNFSRFWNDNRGFCFDVIDTPSGNDANLRPNQLLAVSLNSSPLSKPKQKAIVDACVQQLLTPMGLRSMAQDEPEYIGHYEEDTQQVGAYHRGTVWSWLIGPFTSAHLRVYKDIQAAQAFLEPLFEHLSVRGIGSVSGMFDGVPPFTPHGCIAQAWSVAELLRVWREINVRADESSS